MGPKAVRFGTFGLRADRTDKTTIRPAPGDMPWPAADASDMDGIELTDAVESIRNQLIDAAGRATGHPVAFQGGESAPRRCAAYPAARSSPTTSSSASPCRSPGSAAAGAWSAYQPPRPSPRGRSRPVHQQNPAPPCAASGLDEPGRRTSEWDLDTAYPSLEAQQNPAGPVCGSLVPLRGDVSVGNTTPLWWLPAHASVGTLSPEPAPLNDLVAFVVPLRTLRAQGCTPPPPHSCPTQPGW